MLIQGKAVDDNCLLRADYCVVGSGMGGAAVACCLAGAGKDVLIVEAGQTMAAVNGAPANVTAESTGRPFGIPISRCIELGGTSNAWHGICTPLDEIDFEPRPWLGEPGWPIRRGDLNPFYEEAARIFGHQHLSGLQPEQIPSAIQHELRAIQVEPSVLRPKILEYRTPPFRWKQALIGLAMRGKLRCLLDAAALELVPNDDGSRIAGLKAAAPGRSIHVEAKVYIVAAGALETPRLLLNSRSLSPSGVGNDRDLVGRFLMDHPTAPHSMLRFASLLRARAYSGLPLVSGSDRHDRQLIAALALSPAAQQSAAVPNHYFLLRPCVAGRHVPDDLRLSFLSVQSARDLKPRQLAGILTCPNLLYRILTTKYRLPAWYRYGELFFFAEQLPSPQSRVRLAPRGCDANGYPVASIHWQPGPQDLAAFNQFTRAAFAKGLKSSQYRISREDSIEDWSRRFTSAAHHLGTARMSSSPATGVVNADLQVFGVNNLYLCDGSVFATSGNANPSLTIAALGLRLASYLLHKSA